MSSLAPSSKTDHPRDILLGGVTALAQSAWMGFALASSVLDQIWTAPAGIARRLKGFRLTLPKNFSLRGLLTREFSIGEASFILMAAFFLSAALGSVRQILFNAQFGVSPEANAYYAAFRLPDTLFSLIAGGALSSALIPVLINAKQKDGEAAGWRLVSAVLTLLLAVFIVLILGLEIFTPQLVTSVLAPGFDEPTAQLTINLTRIMLVQPLILLLGSVATAVLNSLIPATLQLTVPPEMRGKTFALLGSVSQGLMPIAMALAGVLAEFLPIRVVIAGSFGFALICFLPLFVVQSFRRFVNFDPEHQGLEDLRL